jgi:hypothetical protein
MPFSQDAFFDLFAEYNETIWPLHIFVFIAGLICVLAVLRPSKTSMMAICILLAAIWLINGVGYHLLHFYRINPAANLFGALFVFEALVLASTPLFAPGLRFSFEKDFKSVIAFTLIVFAVVLYPALSYLAGHNYPRMPVFGVAPCPTVIFTIGILLTGGDWRTVRLLMIAPVIWALVGGSAAFLLGVTQDFTLFAAVLAYAAVEGERYYRRKRSA